MKKLSDLEIKSKLVNVLFTLASYKESLLAVRENGYKSVRITGWLFLEDEDEDLPSNVSNNVIEFFNVDLFENEIENISSNLVSSKWPTYDYIGVYFNNMPEETLPNSCVFSFRHFNHMTLLRKEKLTLYGVVNNVIYFKRAKKRPGSKGLKVPKPKSFKSKDSTKETDVSDSGLCQKVDVSNLAIDSVVREYNTIIESDLFLSAFEAYVKGNDPIEIKLPDNSRTTVALLANNFPMLDIDISYREVKRAMELLHRATKN